MVLVGYTRLDTKLDGALVSSIEPLNNNDHEFLNFETRNYVLVYSLSPYPTSLPR